MVISHRYNYIYFVVPKCASATIRQSLQSFTDIGYPVSQYEQHVTIRQFLASELAGLLDKPYLRFTFVRNPYDRIYSGYQQDKLGSVTWEKWITAKSPIFKEIGDDFNKYIMKHVRHADRENDWQWIHFCPMHHFAYLDGEKIAQFIGKSETIQQDLQELGRILNINIQKSEDYNINTPPQKDLKYLNKYDRATIEVINEIYADDFRLFNYEMLNPSDFPIHAANHQYRNL